MCLVCIKQINLMENYDDTLTHTNLINKMLN